ncbi:MAG: 2-isopropylmalate synthase [Burkholderiaceae bacterium]
MSETVKIFDTTLRDGEQSPGASMTVDEKVIIAKQLEKLRVDIIEAGFAAASAGDYSAVSEVAKNIKNSTVCSLARAIPRDIKAAGEAVSYARKNRIHTFIATSPIHMEKKLRMSPKEVINAAVDAVQLALNYTDDVEFSAEDAVRSDLSFLVEIFEAVIDAGAKTLNVPDTVGYSMPSDWGQKIASLIQKTKNGNSVIWSTHCHNDLGMAVANSLAAVSSGVRQVECTINGIGERAGNASLEEVVMGLKVRNDLYNCETQIDTTQILQTSRLISQITGYQVQPNKAIVGANAFAHESGIHQDGVLKHRETYEIMAPQDVGWATNRIVLGKLSGRNAFKQRLEKLGMDVTSDEELGILFEKFKELADRKTEIFDEDIQSLVSGKNMRSECYRLESLSQESKTGGKPTAEVAFFRSNERVVGFGKGNGPVDATVNAIESKVNSKSQLLLFSVNAITDGTQAQGEVTMRLSRKGRVVNGVGSDPDIVVAAAKAYLNALNRLESEPRINPQQP